MRLIACDSALFVSLCAMNTGGINLTSHLAQGRAGRQADETCAVSLTIILGNELRKDCKTMDSMRLH